MKIKVLIGSINENGLGKLQKDCSYDVPDHYAKAYIKNSWAALDDSDKECKDPKEAVTVPVAKKEAGGRTENKNKDEKGKTDGKKPKEPKKPSRTRKQ